MPQRAPVLAAMDEEMRAALQRV
eukprot:gene11472-biopygen194